MRKSTPAISLAIAGKAPPITRIRIGVASPAPRSASARLRPRAVDDDVAEAVDLGREAGRDDGRRVVLLDDRRALDAVAGAQRLAVVEGRRRRLGLAVDVEDDLALERLRAATGSPSPASISAHWSSSIAADRRATRTLTISTSASKRWPYSRSWARVERLLRAARPRRRRSRRRDVEAHLVALARVAAVGEAADERALLGHAVRVELGDRLRRRARRSALRGAPGRALLSACRSRRDELVLEVGREQPGRRR